MTSKQRRQLRRKQLAEATTTPQIAANQANAQKSTGPVTAQGKETSSRNAQTHGLTSTKVQPNEVVTFEQFLASYTKLYDPQTDIERALVRRCADYQIRIDRALSAEAAFVGECVKRLIEENEGITWDEGLGLLFLDKRFAPRMSLVLRYQSQATRGYNQSKKELQQLIAERRQAEEVAQELARLAAAAQETETKVVMQNGFVWQNDPEPQTDAVVPDVNVPLRT